MPARKRQWRYWCWCCDRQRARMKAAHVSLLHQKTVFQQKLCIWTAPTFNFVSKIALHCVNIISSILCLRYLEIKRYHLSNLRAPRSGHTLKREDYSEPVIEIAPEDEHSAQSKLNADATEIQEAAEALIAALAETRLHGTGSERRREADKVAKKYVQIKALKMREAAGETLEPLQVAKLRSEISVLKALAHFWETQVHLEVNVSGNKSHGVSQVEEAKVLRAASSSGPDLDAIIASSTALHQKSTRQPNAKPVGTDPESLLQKCAAVSEKTGVQLLPWQVAQRRAKQIATNGKVRDDVADLEHSVRRRWGKESTQKIAQPKSQAPEPCCIPDRPLAEPSCKLECDTQVASKEKLKPAHSLRVCIVGDSGLQLNKSKGTSGFEDDLKWVLGPNLEIVRFPGEGAESITRYIKKQRGVAHIVVVVWFLNELFNNNGILLSEYPVGINHLAKELASTLLQFPYHAAVIGGSAALWGASGEFDIWAERIRDTMSQEGVFVVDGIDGYSTLTLKDHWHASSNPKNKERMAAYFANLVRTIVP